MRQPPIEHLRPRLRAVLMVTLSTLLVSSASAAAGRPSWGGSAAVAPTAGRARRAADPFFGRWETLRRGDGLPADKVLAVEVTGDTVWAGTEKGLVAVSTAGVQVWGVEQGLPFPVVTALAADESTGDLWIGTMGGLARWSAGRIDSFTQLDSGLANDVVYGIAVDDGAVWVATAAGLNRYEPATGSWEIFDTSNTLMHEPWCYGVTVEESSVYVAVWGGGVVVRDGRSGRFREHRDPDGEMEVDLFRHDGLVHDVTSAVSMANGVLWVGTYFGLSRYDGRRWNSYGEADSGLAGDFINALEASGDGVWIGTDQGLSHFDSETWWTWRVAGDGITHELRVTRADGTTHTRRVSTGLPSNTVFGIEIDGEDIWLATGGGLTHGVARPLVMATNDTNANQGAQR